MAKRRIDTPVRCLRALDDAVIRFNALAMTYQDALKTIAALPKSPDGDKGEREQNDMEDAFTNGCEVGTYEGYVTAAKIATAALKGNY